MKISEFAVGDMIEDCCGNIIIIKSFIKNFVNIVYIKKDDDNCLFDHNENEIFDSNIHMIEPDCWGDDWDLLLNTVAYTNSKNIEKKMSGIDSEIVVLERMKRGLNHLSNRIRSEKSRKIVNNLKPRELYEINGEEMIYIDYDNGLYRFIHKDFDGNFMPYEFEELIYKNIVHKKDPESKNMARCILRFFDI